MLPFSPFYSFLSYIRSHTHIRTLILYYIYTYYILNLLVYTLKPLQPKHDASVNTRAGTRLFLGPHRPPSAHKVIQSTLTHVHTHTYTNTFIFLEHILVSLEKVRLSGEHTRPRGVMSHDPASGGIKERLPPGPGASSCRPTEGNAPNGFPAHHVHEPTNQSHFPSGVRGEITAARALFCNLY